MSTGERAKIVLKREKQHLPQLVPGILTPTIENHCSVGTNDMYVVLSKKDGILSIANGSYAHEVLMEPLNDMARLRKIRRDTCQCQVT